MSSQKLKIVMLRLTTIAATMPVCTLPASAQQPFPKRAIRLVVPALPGGGTDISARLIAPTPTN